MQIYYEGKITKDDFLKAIILNSPQLKLQRWTATILLVILFSSVLFLLNRHPELLSVLLPGLVVFLIVGTYYWWYPYLQLSSFDQKGNFYRLNVSGMIGDTEITIDNAEIKASIQWGAIVDYRISKDLLLLYQGKNCFNVFKPSMFSGPDEWDKFISLINDKVSVNKKRA